MCTLHLFQDKLIPISYEPVLLTFKFLMVSEINELWKWMISITRMNDFDHYREPWISQKNPKLNEWKKKDWTRVPVVNFGFHFWPGIYAYKYDTVNTTIFTSSCLDRLAGFKHWNMMETGSRLMKANILKFLYLTSPHIIILLWLCNRRHPLPISPSSLSAFSKSSKPFLLFPKLDLSISLPHPYGKNQTLLWLFTLRSYWGKVPNFE